MSNFDIYDFGSLNDTEIENIQVKVMFNQLKVSALNDSVNLIQFVPPQVPFFKATLEKINEYPTTGIKKLAETTSGKQLLAKIYQAAATTSGEYYLRSGAHYTEKTNANVFQEFWRLFKCKAGADVLGQYAAGYMTNLKANLTQLQTILDYLVMSKQYADVTLDQIEIELVQYKTLLYQIYFDMAAALRNKALTDAIRGDEDTGLGAYPYFGKPTSLEKNAINCYFYDAYVANFYGVDPDNNNNNNLNEVDYTKTITDLYHSAAQQMLDVYQSTHIDNYYERYCYALYKKCHAYYKAINNQEYQNELASNVQVLEGAIERLTDQVQVKLYRDVIANYKQTLNVDPSRQNFNADVHDMETDTDSEDEMYSSVDGSNTHYQSMFPQFTSDEIGAATSILGLISPSLTHNS